jgi:hypothetical protein
VVRSTPRSDGPAAEEPRPTDRPARVGLTLALALYAAHVFLYRNHVNDDAFITFRYARHLATGVGPYFNPGEHVEGYTNFLHMLGMASVYALGGESSVPVAARGLGVLAGAAALVAAHRSGLRLARATPVLANSAGTLAGLAAALVAVFPGYALNATSGLETTLLAACIAVAVHLDLVARQTGRWRGAGIAWAAAALTRPEGAAAFAVHWVVARVAVPARSRERASAAMGAGALLDAAIVGLAVVAHLMFRLVAYDGELLPNTWYAKAGGYGGITAWAYVRQGALAPLLGIVGLALGAAGWWRGRALIRDALPLVAVGVCGASLPFLVGTDWMPGWRFSIPYLPVLSVAVVLGWFAGWRPGSGRLARAAPLLAAIVVALAAWWHHGERMQLAEQVELRAAGYRSGHRALAEWLREEALRPGETVALMDVGIVGYYCPAQRILDVSGLTDRFIARQPGPLLAKEYDPAYVLDRRPEMIVLVLAAAGDPRQPLPAGSTLGAWTRMEGRLLEHPRFRSDYRRVREPDPDAPWTQQLAADVGAERVFEHAHPGSYYLLAAFRRDDGAR